MGEPRLSKQDWHHFPSCLQTINIRNKEKDAHEAHIKSASPGKLKKKDGKMWDDWLTGLTLMRGVTDILPYHSSMCFDRIQDDKANPGDCFESFDKECIVKAPIFGPAFQADVRSVHLVINSFLLVSMPSNGSTVAIQRRMAVMT
jgi:hypothetical protein